MPGRRFATAIVSITRPLLVNVSGTLQKKGYISTVITGLEASVFTLRDDKTSTALGDQTATVRGIIDIDFDLLGASLSIQIGDRITDDTGKVWTVEGVQCVEARIWEMDVRRKLG